MIREPWFESRKGVWVWERLFGSIAIPSDRVALKRNGVTHSEFARLTGKLSDRTEPAGPSQFSATHDRIVRGTSIETLVREYATREGALADLVRVTGDDDGRESVPLVWLHIDTCARNARIVENGELSSTYRVARDVAEQWIDHLQRQWGQRG